MNSIYSAAKKKTILISISVLMVSLHTIYFYQSTLPEIDTTKLLQQLIRFSLTLFLLIMMYKGKNWARITGIVLFSLAILLALLALITIPTNLSLKVPFLVMITVYALAIYHFGFSREYRLLMELRKLKKNQV